MGWNLQSTIALVVGLLLLAQGLLAEHARRKIERTRIRQTKEAEPDAESSPEPGVAVDQAAPASLHRPRREVSRR